MPLLNKDAIFDIAEQGFKTAEIPVPSWGGVTARVRELSEAQFRKVSSEMGGLSGQGAAATERAMEYFYDVPVWCLIDESGNRVFEDKEKVELKKRSKTSTFYQGLVEISNAVLELSGLTETEEEDKDDAKN